MTDVVHLAVEAEEADVLTLEAEAILEAAFTLLQKETAVPQCTRRSQDLLKSIKIKNEPLKAEVFRGF